MDQGMGLCFPYWQRVCPRLQIRRRHTRFRGCPGRTETLQLSTPVGQNSYSVDARAGPGNRAPTALLRLKMSEAELLLHGHSGPRLQLSEASRLLSCAFGSLVSGYRRLPRLLWLGRASRAHAD